MSKKHSKIYATTKCDGHREENNRMLSETKKYGDGAGGELTRRCSKVGIASPDTTGKGFKSSITGWTWRCQPQPSSLLRLCHWAKASKAKVGPREIVQWLEHLLYLQKTPVLFLAPTLSTSKPPITAVTGNLKPFYWPTYMWCT